jgi:hypothetical protein
MGFTSSLLLQQPVVDHPYLPGSSRIRAAIAYAAASWKVVAVTGAGHRQPATNQHDVDVLVEACSILGRGFDQLPVQGAPHPEPELIKPSHRS